MDFSLTHWLRHKIRTANQVLCTLNSRHWPSLPLSRPHSAMIEVSTVCNLRCRLCPVGRGLLGRPAEFMPLEVFSRIIDQLNPLFVETIYPAMWGESLLHPEFIEMAEYIQRKDAAYNVVLNTNGNIAPSSLDMSRLVRAGISEVIVALDAHNEECYQQYRVGGNFQKLLSFVAALAEEKYRAGIGPTITGLVILSRFNEDTTGLIQDVFGQYVDVFKNKKMRVFMDHIHKDDFNDSLIDLQPINAEKQYRPPVKTPGVKPVCRSYLDGIYVNVRGELIACCGDPSNYHIFGSLLQHDVRHLRHSRKFLEFKKKIVNDPLGFPQCASCLHHGCV